jgi:hypothetical protein
MCAEPFDRRRPELVEGLRTQNGPRCDRGEDALNERAERGIRRPRSKLVTDDALDVPSYVRRCCRGSPGWSGGAEQLEAR